MYAIFLNQKCFLIWDFFSKGVYAVFLRQKCGKYSDQKMLKKCVCDFLHGENDQRIVSLIPMLLVAKLTQIIFS